jgi:hypothetical protein
MRLIITEKPSMGRDVAAALGVTIRRDGYLEGQPFQYLPAFCKLLPPTE